MVDGHSGTPSCGGRVKVARGGGGRGGGGGGDWGGVGGGEGVGVVWVGGGGGIEKKGISRYRYPLLYFTCFSVDRELPSDKDVFMTSVKDFYLPFGCRGRVPTGTV